MTLSKQHAELQKLIDAAKELSAKKSCHAYDAWSAAAERCAQVVGHYHDWTMFCIINKGKSLVDTHRLEEAIAILETALRQLNSIHGYVHFHVEHACQSLGRAYGKLGKPDLEHVYWTRALYSSQSLRGLSHETSIYCLSQAARALTKQGQVLRALPLYQDLLSRCRTAHGQQVQTAFAARDLAQCLNQLGRFEEAYPHWKLAVKLFNLEPERHGRIRDQTLRCMFWTRDQVREAKRAKIDAMLRSTVGLSEEERDYLASLNLSVNQVSDVLDYLKHGYLNATFREENKNCRNLRVAVQKSRKLMSAYRKKISWEGDRMARDTNFHVSEPDGRKQMVMVGFDHD